MNSHKRIQWIDCIKFISILAVMVDHSYMSLYTNSQLSYITLFSVSVFILISGYTSYHSWNKHQNTRICSEIARKLKSIVYPYALCTAVTMILFYHYFDFSFYINKLISFDVVGPMYFVGVFIQLIIVSPFLYCLINYGEKLKYSALFQVLILLSLIAIASLCINNTMIVQAIGAPIYLLGGTYIVIYYIGMLFAKYERKFSKSLEITLVCIFGLCSFIMWRFICYNDFAIDAYLPFGIGKNPPGIPLMLYGISVFFFLYYLLMLISSIKSKTIKVVINMISYLGSHSLYIFLYHLPILLYLKENFNVNNIHVLRVVFLSAMLILPILFELIANFIKNFTKKILIENR